MVSKNEDEKQCGRIGEIFVVPVFGLCVLGLLELKPKVSRVPDKYSVLELISVTFSPHKWERLAFTVHSQLKKIPNMG